MEYIRHDVCEAIEDIAFLIQKGTLESYELRPHASHPHSMGMSYAVELPPHF